MEGPLLSPGERCLIVEDVVTTGGSTVQAIERVREEGFVIAGVCSVLDRLAGGRDAIETAAGATLQQRLPRLTTSTQTGPIAEPFHRASPVPRLELNICPDSSAG